MAKNKNKEKTLVDEKQKHSYHMVFEKDNYKWMLIGLGIIIIGFILMSGQTDDLFNNGEVFRGKDVSFSTQLKVSWAPIIVLIGLCVEVYAILKKPVATDELS